MSTIFRILLVIAALVLATSFYYNHLLSFFLANSIINGVIAGVFFIGALLVLRNSWTVYRERQWFNYAKAVLDETPYGEQDPPNPKLLLDLAQMINNSPHAHFSLNAQEQSVVVDTLNFTFEQSRETVRYLISLLIFLGLIGTFWGLLHTIQNIGAIVNSLGVDGDAGSFSSLQQGLVGPLNGMGTAFSSSLFGLAGSLVLGLLALIANHAQDRFSAEVQNWLAGHTRFGIGEHTNGANNAPSSNNGAFEASLVEGLVNKLDRVANILQEQNDNHEQTYRQLTQMNSSLEKLTKTSNQHQEDIKDYMSQSHEIITRMHTQSAQNQKQLQSELKDNMQLIARTISKK